MTLIQELLPRYAPDAVLPGPNELALGAGTLSRRLPWVASNDTVGRLFAPFRTARPGGARGPLVGVYGYLSPALVYQGSQSAFRLRPADAALVGALAGRIRREGHRRTILLFRGGDAELKVFRDSGLFQLIISGNPSSDELRQVTERRVDGALIPQVPTKGQGLLRITLPGRDGSGGGAGAPRWTVDWLKDNWPDHPKAAPVFNAYNEKVKARFEADMALLETQARASPYTGAERCIACHPAAGAAWRKSRHAHALATLTRVRKNFDPECLACHVVGLNTGSGRPGGREGGGYLNRMLTPKLANVQCENCHGPGKAHAANPTVRTRPYFATGPAAPKPDARTCRLCHQGSHSPTFDYSRYWPKIQHGKGTPPGPQARAAGDSVPR